MFYNKHVFNRNVFKNYSNNIDITTIILLSTINYNYNTLNITANNPTIQIFYTLRLRRTPSLRLSVMFRLIALQIDTSKRCNYRSIDSSGLRISK